MAVRSELFRDSLCDPKYRQGKEGYCWPALVEALLVSRGITNWKRDDIASSMGTSTAYGTDTDDVIAFLTKNEINSYPEDGISTRRLLWLMKNLPVGTDIIACIWDKRVSPGYTRLTDPPESHNVALLETPMTQRGRRVVFFDTSTYIGGVLDWSLERWKRFWFGGPESMTEPDKNGEPIPYVPGSILVVGASKRLSLF